MKQKIIINGKVEGREEKNKGGGQKKIRSLLRGVEG
jgi:hypothetical protein